MSISLFNTLHRKVEPFLPIEKGSVKFYACGPTVYNYAHIGNLRTYVFEDLLRRVLEKEGFTVNHVMNITDVGHLESDADDGEDKMAKASKREQKDPWQIAKYYEEAFFADTSKLNILRPHIVCRATDHIKEMIDFILVLQEKGFTYESGGNIYFSIDSFPSYADFSRRNLEDLLEGARVEVDSNKKNPLDFVLWFRESKFKNQIMKWPSPFGEGFPGWHIECSAMASKYLGDKIDIHAGGIDHISIHHTNEIAQSEAHFGSKWVNYWLHGEFLVLKKQKMSKSLGTFLTLQSLIDKGFHPLHYRYLCLQSHYRSQLLFSEEALLGAKNAFNSLHNRYLQLKFDTPKGKKNDNALQKSLENFWTAMRDDLNSPKGLAVMWDTIKDAKLSSEDKISFLHDIDDALGFDIKNFTAPVLPKEQMELIEQREQARLAKDYKKSDELRDLLFQQGVCIKDTKEGPRWYLKSL